MSWEFYTASGTQKTNQNLGSEFPIGTIVDYAGLAAPANWLLCDGSAVSRTTYSELFNVVGTYYGAGNGTTTFNLPDSTGQIIYFQRGPAALTYANNFSAPTLVSSLPASPFDGQEVYYQADATNGVIWHLRYRQGSSSQYKWEFIGGSEMSANNSAYLNTGAAALALGAYQDVPGGVTLTAPLAGDYMVEFAGRADSTTSNVSNYVVVTLATSAITATSQDSNAALFGHGGLSFSTNYMRQGFSRMARLNGVAASAVVKMQVAGSATTSVIHFTSMNMRPVRVG